MRGLAILYARGDPIAAFHDLAHSVPLRDCSSSIASNRALKFPLPKLRAPGAG